MNWVDYLLIAIVLLGVFTGLRTGLIIAAFSTAGALIGWQLAGLFSDNVGEVFRETPVADTWVTTISYFIIIVLTITLARYIAKLASPALAIFTVGLSTVFNKLGGLALGLIMGIAVGGAVIIVLARLTYDFELLEKGIAGEIVNRVPQVERTRQTLENALVTSPLVPVFINVANSVPGNALGFVPSDFKVSLDVLKRNIDERNPS